MRKYFCIVCNYVYDFEKGDSGWAIEAGNKNVLEDCPQCHQSNLVCVDFYYKVLTEWGPDISRWQKEHLDIALNKFDHLLSEKYSYSTENEKSILMQYFGFCTLSIQQNHINLIERISW